jgi:hypothetical protein
MLVRSLICSAFLVAYVLTLAGCGDSNAPAIPDKVEPVPANAPVDEPPSTDEM